MRKRIEWVMGLMSNNSLDASGGSVFLNLPGAAGRILIRAAASTQTLGRIAILFDKYHEAIGNHIEACMVSASGRK
jgi:hypothetical protein